MAAPDPNEALREAVRNALRELLPDLGTGHAATNGHAATKSHAATNGHTTTDAAARRERSTRSEPEVVPLVPAPPVAAVLRPSTWSGPMVPGEVIGGGSPGAPAGPVRRAGLIAPALTTGPAVRGAAAPAPPPSDARPTSDVPARATAQPPAVHQARSTPAGATVETVTIDSDDDLQAFVRSLVARLESPRDRLAIKAGRLRFRLQRSAAPVGAPAPQAVPAVRVPRGAVTERHVREAHAAGSCLVLARAAVLTPLARETARTLDVQIERETQC